MRERISFFYGILTQMRVTTQPEEYVVLFLLSVVPPSITPQFQVELPFFATNGHAGGEKNPWSEAWIRYDRRRQ
jgi:hypothetical protein